MHVSFPLVNTSRDVFRVNVLGGSSHKDFFVFFLKLEMSEISTESRPRDALPVNFLKAEEQEGHLK